MCGAAPGNIRFLFEPCSPALRLLRAKQQIRHDPIYRKLHIEHHKEPVTATLNLGSIESPKGSVNAHETGGVRYLRQKLRTTGLRMNRTLTVVDLVLFLIHGVDARSGPKLKQRLKKQST